MFRGLDDAGINTIVDLIETKLADGTIAVLFSTRPSTEVELANHRFLYEKGKLRPF